MIDEKKLIEELQTMPDKCMLFRWRSAKKIKEGLERIISAQPKIGEWFPCSGCERKCEKWENSKI